MNGNNSVRKYMQRHTALTESWCFTIKLLVVLKIIGSLSEVTYSVDLLFTNPQIKTERIFCVNAIVFVESKIEHTSILTTLRPSISTVETSNLRPLLRKSSSTSFPYRSITKNRSLVELWSKEPEPRNMGTPRCFRRRDLHQLFTSKKKHLNVFIKIVC